MKRRERKEDSMGRKTLSFSLPYKEFIRFSQYCENRGISKYSFFRKVVRDALSEDEVRNKKNIKKS